MNLSKHSIAIVGATGLVGSTLLSLIEEKQFPFDRLYLVASQQSAGSNVTFKGQKYPIYDLAHFDFSQTTIAFFCVGNDLAAEYAPRAVCAGNIVIDKSYHFRNHPDVPLIVPEVNLQCISEYQKKRHYCQS